jgi:hypothetical protein
MLDINRKTVRKVLNEAESREKHVGSDSLKRDNTVKGWPSMLDPHREYIEIQMGKELSIVRIHEDLQREFGITCGYTTL